MGPPNVDLMAHHVPTSLALCVYVWPVSRPVSTRSIWFNKMVSNLLCAGMVLRPWSLGTQQFRASPTSRAHSSSCSPCHLPALFNPTPYYVSSTLRRPPGDPSELGRVYRSETDSSQRVLVGKRGKVQSRYHKNSERSVQHALEQHSRNCRRD